MAALTSIYLHRAGPAIRKEQQSGGRTTCKQRRVSMKLVFAKTISMELVSNTAALGEKKILYELYSSMGRP
jgi:hypothetical protein